MIRGVPTRVWKNAPPSLAFLARHSRIHGERLFTIYEDERVGFEASFRATAALAAELARRGVGKGDRVAIAMANLPEWPAAFFAIVSLGAIAVPLNAWWTGPELEYRPRRFGREAADLRFGAVAADRAAPGRSARPRARPRQPRRRGVGRRGAARGADRRPAGLERPSRLRPPRRADRCRRSGDDPLHQRHHRPAQGRARHPPQPAHQHPLGRLFQRPGGASPRRGAARAAAEDRPDRHPALPLHRAERDADGDDGRRPHHRLHAQMGSARGAWRSSSARRCS